MSALWNNLLYTLCVTIVICGLKRSRLIVKEKHREKKFKAIYWKHFKIGMSKLMIKDIHILLLNRKVRVQQKKQLRILIRK